MITVLLHCIASRILRVATPDVVTTATHTETLNSYGFRRILNGKYNLVITEVHARKELYFTVHKSLFCDLKIYRVVSCINRVCCTRYTVVSTYSIF
jgi:hypothetical protein